MPLLHSDEEIKSSEEPSSHIRLLDDEEKDPLSLNSCLEETELNIKLDLRQKHLEGHDEKQQHCLRRNIPRIIVKPILTEHISKNSNFGTNERKVICNKTIVRSPNRFRIQQQNLSDQKEVVTKTLLMNDSVASTSASHASAMSEVLASLPKFGLKPRRRSSKKISTAAQIEQTKDGKIDLETPDSILASTNLRALLNKQTFSMLPPFYQYNLIQLLPSVDRDAIVMDQQNVNSTLPIEAICLGPSSLNNEFFARACLEWRERLAEGEFTPENQLKLKTEAEREKSKLDPWKLKHFEPIWGEKASSSRCSVNKNMKADVMKCKTNLSSFKMDINLEEKSPALTNSRENKQKRNELSSDLDCTSLKQFSCLKSKVNCNIKESYVNKINLQSSIEKMSNTVLKDMSDTVSLKKKTLKRPMALVNDNKEFNYDTYSAFDEFEFQSVKDNKQFKIQNSNMLLDRMEDTCQVESSELFKSMPFHNAREKKLADNITSLSQSCADGKHNSSSELNRSQNISTQNFCDESVLCISGSNLPPTGFTNNVNCDNKHHLSCDLYQYSVCSRSICHTEDETDAQNVKITKPAPTESFIDTTIRQSSVDSEVTIDENLHSSEKFSFSVAVNNDGSSSFNKDDLPDSITSPSIINFTKNPVDLQVEQSEELLDNSNCKHEWNFRDMEAFDNGSVVSENDESISNKNSDEQELPSIKYESKGSVKEENEIYSLQDEEDSPQFRVVEENKSLSLNHIVNELNSHPEHEKIILDQSKSALLQHSLEQSCVDNMFALQENYFKEDDLEISSTVPTAMSLVENCKELIPCSASNEIDTHSAATSSVQSLLSNRQNIMQHEMKLDTNVNVIGNFFLQQQDQKKLADQDHKLLQHTTHISLQNTTPHLNKMEDVPCEMQRLNNKNTHQHISTMQNTFDLQTKNDQHQSLAANITQLEIEPQLQATQMQMFQKKQIQEHYSTIPTTNMITCANSLKSIQVHRNQQKMHSQQQLTYENIGQLTAAPQHLAESVHSFQSSFQPAKLISKQLSIIAMQHPGTAGPTPISSTTPLKPAISSFPYGHTTPIKIQSANSLCATNSINNSSSKCQINSTVANTFTINQNTILTQRPSQKGAPGKGRKITNKLPPGAVNLERSYQICQAVIQNSPNRENLKAQLRPPSAILNQQQTSVSIGGLIQSPSSTNYTPSNLNYTIQNTQLPPSSVSITTNSIGITRPGVYKVIGPRMGFPRKKFVQRKQDSPTIIRQMIPAHISPSSNGEQLTLISTTSQQQEVHQNNSGQYVLLHRANVGSAEQHAPRASSAPPVQQNQSQIVGVNGLPVISRGRPASVDIHAANFSQDIQNSLSKTVTTSNVLSQNFTTGNFACIDGFGASNAIIDGNNYIVTTATPASLSIKTNADSLPTDGNNCTCSLNAMVICQQCGAFCHDDCVSTSKICVSCVIR